MGKPSEAPEAESAPIFAIVGSTASGKSAFALEAAEFLNTAILSADSMQVYRGMDIGSAKPSREELARVAHYGIDIADPTEPFSVADYCRMATPVLEDFQRRNKPILICGGTGLYFKSLLEGLAEAPPPDLEYRARMEKQAMEEGNAPLYEILAARDPEAAHKIHPNDRKRIIRALEIMHSTGRTKTEYERSQPASPWAGNVRWIGLIRDWPELDARINRRVGEMFQSGLLEEVMRLRENGCTLRHIAMQGLGYKEVFRYLDGESGLDETMELIRQRTRRYARRQMTWFRQNTAIDWRLASEAHAAQLLRQML